jgi:hypothetical protein
VDHGPRRDFSLANTEIGRLLADKRRAIYFAHERAELLGMSIWTFRRQRETLHIHGIPLARRNGRELGRGSGLVRVKEQSSDNTLGRWRGQRLQDLQAPTTH